MTVGREGYFVKWPRRPRQNARNTNHSAHACLLCFAQVPCSAFPSILDDRRKVVVRLSDYYCLVQELQRIVWYLTCRLNTSKTDRFQLLTIIMTFLFNP